MPLRSSFDRAPNIVRRDTHGLRVPYCTTLYRAPSRSHELHSKLYWRADKDMREEALAHRGNEHHLVTGRVRAVPLGIDHPPNLTVLFTVSDAGKLDLVINSPSR